MYPIASLSGHPFVKEKVVVGLVLGGGRGQLQQLSQNNGS